MAASSSSAVSQVNTSIERERVGFIFDKLNERFKTNLYALTTVQLQRLFDEAAASNSFNPISSTTFIVGGTTFKYLRPETALMLIRWSVTRMYASDLQNFLENTKLSFFSKVLHQDRLADPEKLKKQLDKVEKQVSYLSLIDPRTRVGKRNKINDLRTCRTRLWQIKNEIGNLQATLSLQEGIIPPIKIVPVQIKKRIGPTAMIILKWVLENKGYFHKKTLTAINTFNVSEKTLDEETTDEEMDAWKGSYKSTLMRIEDEKDGLLKKVQSEMTKLAAELDDPSTAIVEEHDDADTIIEAAECLSILLRPPLPLPGKPAIAAEVYAQQKLNFEASDWQGIAKEAIAKGITLEILRSCKTEAELLEVVTGITMR